VTMGFLSSLIPLMMLIGSAQYVQSEEETISYGVDVVSSPQRTRYKALLLHFSSNFSFFSQSYPMQRDTVTNNYAWLPWNVDPSIPTPDEYKGMPVQPLGDKQSFYEDFSK
jgi:hypothetical protein